MKFTVKPTKRLFGSLTLPGDKSISHRAIMLGSIAKGTSVIKNILRSEDTEATIAAFRALGVDIKEGRGEAVVSGRGLFGLSRPFGDLNMRNSGTTMRLIMGILAGQPFETVLTADESLAKRPMRRVTEPLCLMGAQIGGRDGAEHAPITIRGGRLKAIDYASPVASAQVKSAVLLAGLYADGATSVTEPSRSRDHTERMLSAFGAEVLVDGLKVSVEGGPYLKSRNIEVPGDISSAAFFMVAASIVKGSSIDLKAVGINPTRAGVIDVLKMMGAKIKIEKIREVASEPVADIFVESSHLRGVTIEGDLIPRAIDELPVIMAAAACAEGVTVINGAQELKVKETDRITSMAENLKRMGAGFRVEGERIAIEGSKDLKGASVRTFGDHRTAMSMIVAGLAANGETTIDDTACVAKSYPRFIEDLESLLS